MLAFSRFTSRRGHCNHIYSDCGTNFVGASSELSRLFSEKSAFSKNLIHQMASLKVQWHFSPPASPHFGGLWESAVRSTKYHLKRVIGETTLTYEELSTLLYSVEACLNSRPLCPINDDANDLTYLTPSHFLLGKSLVTTPDEYLFDQSIGLLKRWKLLHQFQNDFWTRWKRDYIQSIQLRSKWLKPSPNVKLGSMVLIRSENSSPARWPLGRVTQIHPGSDGVVRVVTVKTAQSSYKRPIVKLVLLPIESNCQ